MSRKGMDLEQFNAFMKRCADVHKVRYVTPTIHPGFKQIVSVTIHTDSASEVFFVTNNPDENFDLDKEVNAYLDTLSVTQGG